MIFNNLHHPEWRSTLYKIEQIDKISLFTPLPSQELSPNVHQVCHRFVTITNKLQDLPKHKHIRQKKVSFTKPITNLWSNFGEKWGKQKAAHTCVAMSAAASGWLSLKPRARRFCARYPALCRLNFSASLGTTFIFSTPCPCFQVNACSWQRNGFTSMQTSYLFGCEIEETEMISSTYRIIKLLTEMT